MDFERIVFTFGNLVKLGSSLVTPPIFRFLFLMGDADGFMGQIANRFALIFKASAAIIAIDFLLTVIWLPIGVSKTYGFRSAEFVFKTRYNGTGAVSSFLLFSLPVTKRKTDVDVVDRVKLGTGSCRSYLLRGF